MLKSILPWHLAAGKTSNLRHDPTNIWETCSKKKTSVYLVSPGNCQTLGFLKSIRRITGERHQQNNNKINNCKNDLDWKAGYTKLYELTICSDSCVSWNLVNLWHVDVISCVSTCSRERESHFTLGVSLPVHRNVLSNDWLKQSMPTRMTIMKRNDVMADVKAFTAHQHKSSCQAGLLVRFWRVKVQFMLCDGE